MCVRGSLRPMLVDASAPENRPRRTSGPARFTAREATAERLLAASAKHSYDPDTAVDWDVPLEPGHWFMPPELLSLHDTPLWEAMPHAQRLELSRHELSAWTSRGIWFEIILLQLLARHIYDKPFTSAHSRYALTEIADECRHSLMFARMLDRCGAPPYPVSRPLHHMARVVKTCSSTPGSFAATLFGEEISDWMQRIAMRDERVQPLVRDVFRIHVIEEARHVRYAREELRRLAASRPRWRRVATEMQVTALALALTDAYVRRDVYAAVGLPPGEAVRQAKASEARRHHMREATRKLTAFLQDIGLLTGASSALWRRAGLLA